jgi:hypothetical protein
MPIPSSFYYAECLLGIALSLSHLTIKYNFIHCVRIGYNVPSNV